MTCVPCKRCTPCMACMHVCIHVWVRLGIHVSLWQIYSFDRITTTAIQLPDSSTTKTAHSYRPPSNQFNVASAVVSADPLATVRAPSVWWTSMLVDIVSSIATNIFKDHCANSNPDNPFASSSSESDQHNVSQTAQELVLRQGADGRNTCYTRVGGSTVCLIRFVAPFLGRCIGRCMWALHVGATRGRYTWALHVGANLGGASPVSLGH